MKKFVAQLLPVAIVFSALACVVVSSGCGSAAPPPAPVVEEVQTEEYIQGEESYTEQQ